MNYVSTRHRTNDPESSRLAAKTASGGKAAELRRAIQLTLQLNGPMTARRIAFMLDEDYYSVQRRLSETAHIRKTGAMVDGAMVWEFEPGA